MDIEILSELFDYSENSASGLIHKKANRSKKPGDLAGTKRSPRVGRSVWTVRVGNRKIDAHRVVYALVTGDRDMEGYEIDHINGDSLDNRIENLRKVTTLINCRNKSGSSWASSGVRGVYLCTGGKRYAASVSESPGKVMLKYFRISKFGNAELAKQAAIEWRLSQILRLNENGAGYTMRHIKDLL